ncbi:exported protein [Staphylococcus aureus]|nr:exported protein [Staphylococcus aureus]
MWNFIKCVFKFVFSLVAITTLVAGVGVVAFAYIFKKDFEDIESSLKSLAKILCIYM